MPEIQPNHDALTPVQMLDKSIAIGEAKAHNTLIRLLPLSILAGSYIAMGAVFASVVAVGMPGMWPYGIMKLLQGLVFSMGLILVVVGGAELFTGNNLMAIAWFQHKISLWQMLRNWLIVYAGNFIGSLLIAVMVLVAGVQHNANGELGQLILTTANAKLTHTFTQSLFLGVLCNMLVCLAVWLTYSGRSVVDKIAGIVFPITLFVAAGFEHSVANMYILPVGIMMKTFDPGFIAGLNLDLSGLTWGAFLVKNLLPVTLGNILGGSFIVGGLYYWSYVWHEK